MQKSHSELLITNTRIVHCVSYSTKHTRMSISIMLFYNHGECRCRCIVPPSTIISNTIQLLCFHMEFVNKVNKLIVWKKKKCVYTYILMIAREFHSQVFNLESINQLVPLNNKIGTIIASEYLNVVIKRHQWISVSKLENASKRNICKYFRGNFIAI